jgi:hypothetical protein
MTDTTEISQEAAQAMLAALRDLLFVCSEELDSARTPEMRAARIAVRLAERG